MTTGRREDGSALILTLVFLVVVALLVLPMVTFLDAGQQSTKAMRLRRDVVLAAEGAVDAAINRFRTGAACEDYVAPKRSDPDTGQPVAVGDAEMVVRCSQQPVTAGPRATKPAQALLALGTDPAEDGIVSPSGNLQVRGDVFANSPRLETPAGASILVGGAGMVVEGTVGAIGDCSPLAKVQTNPVSPLRCANAPDGPADPVRGRDPDFGKRLTTVPPRGAITTGDPPVPLPVPFSCPSEWRVDVWPGYYDDPTVLNSLTAADPACSGKVLWLHPGDYHFNFGFRAGTPTAWTIDDPTVNVVGGSARGGWPALASRPTPAQLPVPGGCRAEDDPAPGVQIVMGGGSRLDVPRGRVELCASPSLNDQRIAIYGMPAPRAVHTLVPTRSASTGSFSDPVNATLIGETGPGATADAGLTPTEPAASLTLDDFRRFLPVDAVLVSAVLRVAHQETGDVGAAAVALPIEVCGPVTDRPLVLRPGLTEDTFDLRAECGPDLTSSLSDGCGPPPLVPCLSATYKASLAAAGAAGGAVLDGIWVDVAYREPVTRRPTGSLPVPSDAAFVGAAGALEIGEQPTALTADASIAAPAVTASLKLGGFADPPVPPGSTVDYAVLRVAHYDEGDVGTITVTVPGSCGTRPPLTESPTPVVERLDLKACGLTAADVNDFTVTYTTTRSGTGTATPHVDGIELDLVLGPPPARLAVGDDNGAGGFGGSPANAVAIDGAVATASLDSGALPPKTTASATLGTLGGYGPSLPPGSQVESATLLVAHQETGTVPPVVSVKASDDGGATFCLPETALAPSTGTIATGSVDLLDWCDLTDLALVRVVYQAALAPGGTTATAGLDGIELDLRYRPSANREPAVDDGGAGGFTTNPANARVIDGASAAAVLKADLPVTTASITLTGYGLALPSGASLEYAKLRVVHQDDGDVPPVVTVKASIDGGATFCLPETAVSTSPATAGTETVDLLDACDLSDPALLGVTYTASLGVGGTTATVALDGIELDLLFLRPSFDPVSGCAAAVPYPATGCALVKVASNGTGINRTRFVVGGTVYAPGAPIDLALTEVGSQVVTRGIVARAIRLGVTALASYRRPIVAVPPEAVLFEAWSARTLVSATATDESGFALAPDDGRVIDGDFATGSAAGGGSASLLLSGWGAPSAAYAGDPVVRVRHQEAAGVEEIRVVVTLADATTRTFSSADSPCRLCNSGGAQVEDHLLLTGVTPAQLAGATVRYEVVNTAGGTETADLDGIEIVEVLAGPRLRARVQFDPDKTTVVGWSVLR